MRKRSQYYQKVKAVDDDKFYAEWGAAHPNCQACGSRTMLSRHHIIKFKRNDEPCNLLMLCQRCHDLAEGRLVRQDGELLPKLTIAICLAIKKLREPDDYDPQRLQVLYGQALPEPGEIPEFLTVEYRRRIGSEVAELFDEIVPPDGFDFS